MEWSYIMTVCTATALFSAVLFYTYLVRIYFSFSCSYLEKKEKKKNFMLARSLGRFLKGKINTCTSTSHCNNNNHHKLESKLTDTLLMLLLLLLLQHGSVSSTYTSSSTTALHIPTADRQTDRQTD